MSMHNICLVKANEYTPNMKINYAPIIENLTIDGKPAPYPVVNERAVRATAGIMFLIGISTFWYVRLTKDYAPINIVVPLFWLDFFIKAVVTPRWSFFWRDRKIPCA